MKTRPAYPEWLKSAAGNVARKTMERRGVRLETVGRRQYIVRTVAEEGLAILKSQRSWPLC
jgi:hypothetical protein